MRILSVQVSYKKQFILGIMLISVLLVAFEGLLRVYDYQNPNCFFTESDVFANIDNDWGFNACEEFEIYRPIESTPNVG